MLRVFDWTTNSFTPRILRYNSLHKKVSKSPSISIKMMRTDTKHCPGRIWCPPSVTQHFSTQSSLPLCCMSGQSCIWLPPTTHNAGATDGWGGLAAKTHALCGWVFNFYSCLMSLHKGCLEIKKHSVQPANFSYAWNLAILQVWPQSGMIMQQEPCTNPPPNPVLVGNQSLCTLGSWNLVGVIQGV